MQTFSEDVLTDAEWEQVKHLLPLPKPNGAPIDNRRIFSAIVWIARNRKSWASLPDGFPAYQSVYARFRKWNNEGVIAPALQALSIPMPEPQPAGAKKRQASALQPQEGLAGWLFARPVMA